MSADLLLERLLAEQGISLGPGRRIPPRPPEAEVDATSAQRRLWLLEKLAPGDPEYLISAAFRLVGRLDEAALAAALRYLWRRHEPLRTAFAESGERLVQRIAEVDDLHLVPSAVPVDLGDRKLSDVLVEHTRLPVDLGRPPLWRVNLLRLSEEDHCLQFTVHHTVCDGDGLRVLTDDLFAGYAAFANGAEPDLPPLTVQFADFAAWRAFDPAREDYWKQALADIPAALDLPTDLPRPAARSGRGAGHRFTLPATLAEGIGALRIRYGCTTHTVLLSGFMILLARYSGQDDIVVGAPVSDRVVDGAERMVGMMVNTVALRADLAGNPTIEQVLAGVQRTCLAAIDNSHVPFERLVELAGVSAEPGRNPLFQVMIVHEQGGGPPPEVPGLAAEAVAVDHAPAHFDLTLRLTEEPGALHGRMDYARDLFRAPTIARMAEYLEKIIAAMIADPRQGIRDIELVPDEALVHHLIDDQPPCVLSEFRVRAEQDPDAPAVVGGGRRLDYRQLAERVDAVAAYLREAGVGPETRVGLGLRTGPEAIIGLLGILKAGGAYVPLDPDSPSDRLDYQIRDAAIMTVVTATEQADRFGACRIVLTDTPAADVTASVDIEAGHLAYLIYTSGTSGTPKGVMVEHGSLRHLTRHYRDLHGFRPGHRVLMIPPLTFDASVADVFAVLTSGATLVFHPHPGQLSGQDLVDFCAAESITAVDAPAALWQRWTDDLAGGTTPADLPLTMMMVGGESVPLDKVRTWAAATGGRVTLWNHYGPTEATVCATTYLTVDGTEVVDATNLPVGRPLPHVRAYVLDHFGRPCPIGVPGQLHLGGPGVARGYLNHPGLTAGVFLPDPFNAGRMYATGDRVRLSPDGNLEFLGRTDRQLKISGYRAEPAEIEAACTRLPGVAKAIVDVRSDATGNRMLVGWLIPTDDDLATFPEIRAHLKETLPRYLIPTTFVWTETFPLTPHGKIDYAALPAPARHLVTHPGSDAEAAIVALVSELVGHTEVGTTDMFFDVGGSSLATPLLRNQIFDCLGVELDLKDLFEKDIATLARQVDEKRERDREAGEPSCR